jgi:hypothetical protein
MNKQKILKAFKQAEIDWSKPIIHCYKNDTDYGLCNYFQMKGYSIKDTKIISKYWQKYRTTGRDSYHFYSRGREYQGRQERLEAIRKVIKDLEKSWWKKLFRL